MFLFIGPPGSGKSTLIKQLVLETNEKKATNSRRKNSKPDTKFEELPTTIPTVGTNVVKLSLHKKTAVEVRELGGCMGPIWKSYYGAAKGVVYVVDSSSPQQISSAVVQLLNALKHLSQILGNSNRKTKFPVLVVFSKSDVPRLKNISQLKSMFQLNYIEETFADCVQIDCIELSCLDKESVDDVKDWLIHQFNSR